MYFDRRLWQFTEGLRLRIAGAVLLGLLSAAVGIARLALLGWLLGRVFQGESFDDLVLPIAAVAAAMVARGVLEYWRTMEAHRTAASLLKKGLFRAVSDAPGAGSTPSSTRSATAMASP